MDGGGAVASEPGADHHFAVRWIERVPVYLRLATLPGPTQSGRRGIIEGDGGRDTTRRAVRARKAEPHPPWCSSPAQGHDAKPPPRGYPRTLPLLTAGQPARRSDEDRNLTQRAT